MSADARVQALLREAQRLIERNDARGAERVLLSAHVLAPTVWPVLKADAEFNRRAGRPEAAARTLNRARELHPENAAVLIACAALASDSADFEQAHALLLAASARAQSFSDWLELSIEYDRQGDNAGLKISSAAALQLKPQDATARLLHARSASALGHIEAAVTDYRCLLKQRQHIGRSWFALLDLKTVKPSALDIADLELAARDRRLDAFDQTLLGFALGRAYEINGDFARAFATFTRANAQVQSGWDAVAFSKSTIALESAVAQVNTSAVGQGSEVIFLVGLPRSGTTLIEQILASHSWVEGASELSYLPDLIAQESARRRAPVERWVPLATDQDWQRLGQSYLQQSARWRRDKRISTDKLPENWLLAGIALKMLPGARVIDCRRDALETCWSCYKQLFATGRVGFSYSLDNLAAYWHDYVRTCQSFSQQFPAQFKTQSYEALTHSPEPEIRALLAFCGLEFEASCLEPNRTERSVRSASAAQVREPIQKNTARALRYGELLAPLREKLASKP